MAAIVLLSTGCLSDMTGDDSVRADTDAQDTALADVGGSADVADSQHGAYDADTADADSRDIDANPFTDGNNLLVAYRDDYINTFPETGISVVRTDDMGRAQWSTRRDLLESTDIEWDTIRINGSSHVIENPSMFRKNGVWYLAFSANNWDSARYATGIARCGDSPLPSQRCTPLRRGVERPYFGFTGEAGLDPYRGLPGNRRGPGGMDVFRAADGTLRAVWHWWRPSDRSRHSVVGRLLRDAGGFYVGQ